MKISIFGLGYVGCVSAACLAKNGYTVIGVDSNESKVNQLNSGQATIIEKGVSALVEEGSRSGLISATMDWNEAVLNTELSIVAVGTPSTENGHLNLEHVFQVAKQIGEALKNKESFHAVAIRSTVMPGTCQKAASIIEEVSGKKKEIDFSVFSNPEFLREGSAVKDYLNPPFTLIGAEDAKKAQTLADIYSSLPAEVVITETKAAEILKYINNSWHALKISFANEVGCVCKSLGINSHHVMDIFCKDSHLNISPAYLKPGFAYGGSCLPKDLKGLLTLAHDAYIKVPVVESIDKTNDMIIENAVKKIVSLGLRKIGLLGLSFKAGTDDLRNSANVRLAEILIGKGYELQIFDRNIHLSRLLGTNKEFIDRTIPHFSTLLCDDPYQLKEQAELLVVGTREDEFVSLLNEENEKPILDLVYLHEDLISKSNYHSITW